MTSQVIDTSALVKYVLPEEDSSVAEKLVASHHAGMVNLTTPEYIGNVSPDYTNSCSIPDTNQQTDSRIMNRDPEV